MTPTPTGIKVLIIESQPMMRSHLVKLVGSQKDMEVVGDSPTIQAAIPSLNIGKPSVVMYNLVTPIAELHSALERFRIHAIPTVMFAATNNALFVDSALTYGAVCYLHSDNEHDTLLEMLRAAAHKKAHHTPDTLASQRRAEFREMIVYNLSKREFEILQYTANGLSNQQIAALLGISVSTVKKHVSRVLDVFETKNRTTAVAIALRNRIID